MEEGWAVAALFEARDVVFLPAAPLWLTCALQYAGREKRLTRSLAAMLSAVPLATLALILTDGGLVWSSESTRRTGGTPGLLADFSNGPWFWVDFLYAATLFGVGAALLVIMVVNAQRLYARQSASLLLGVLGPWIVYAANALGLFAGSRLVPGLDPTVLAFAPAGLALVWGMYRYGLLDLSPVAHDAVVEGMSDGTLVLDRQGRVVDLNPAAARILRCEADEVIGVGFHEVMRDRGRVAPLAGGRGGALLRRFEQEGRAIEEVRLGEGARHYDLALSALHDARGRRTGALVVMHEITERKLAVERLDQMAHFDALTGLANRVLFHERLSQEIARSRRVSAGGKLLALMFLDLDRFKSVNDTLGHAAGDLLPQETASRLKESVRKYDVVSRLGGDEFTVILPDLGGARDAVEVAERITESIARPYLLGEQKTSVSTSSGISFYPNDGHDPATLVANADTAMYRAKASGKNRYEIYAAEVLRSRSRRSETEADLERALAYGELVLSFQPAIRIDTGRMLGAEALIRWDHPERGLLSPEDFLPHSEETGQIFPIEHWALREACGRMRSWLDRYPTDTPLTRRHFAHPNLRGVVASILEETGLPPENLILEIKESVLHEDPISAAAAPSDLKDLGVRLAVDDFGAGYSSLQQLRRFPLDGLKIDASFTGMLDKSEDDRRMVAAVVDLAHALGLGVVAQGVDAPRQLMQLNGMGCEISQGNYFAAAFSHRAAAAFLVADLYC